jgi:hypothetical protein
MVTLEDPDAPLEPARGAFARLRPPESLSPAETRSWAESVRAVARAVRVLPTRRSALLTPTRVGEDIRPIGTIREEVRDLVREADDLDLHDVVEGILSEVERGKAT